MSPLLRQARSAALLIGCVFAFAVAGHCLIGDRPLIDGVYWTVVTLASVGYSHETPPTIGFTEKAFTIIVIVMGTCAVAYTLGVMLRVIVEGQFAKALGDRRMIKDISRLKDHVIICGYGRMGRQLAQRLAKQGAPLVIVDAKASVLEEAKEDGCLFVEGDATSEDVLEHAGIGRAQTIVVVLHSDADNVYLTLTARNMNPTIHILARGEQLATEKKLRQAGANQVVLPAVIGAQQMADFILRPHAAHLMYGFGHQMSTIDASLDEFAIAEGSPLVGKTLRDAETRQKHRVLIVAVRRVGGELIFNPDAEVDFRAGDTLVIIGQAAAVKDFVLGHKG